MFFIMSYLFTFEKHGAPKIPCKLAISVKITLQITYFIFAELQGAVITLIQ